MGRRISVWVILLGGLCAFWWSARHNAPSPGRVMAAEGGAPATEGLKWQGVASCTRSNCHGGNGPAGSKGSEYTTWIAGDRHAKAFSVLYDKRSLSIEKNLKNLKDVKEAHPEKNRLCLGCHSADVPEKLRDNQFSLEDGVGCESCHGPAEKWREQHFREKLSPEQKTALGMRDTKDLLARGKLCASCHVGTSAHNVDHDLIAAGHPPLKFEYGVHLFNMPKHWDADKDKARYADFEARVWALGQAASAQASLELLEHRARTEKQPWPELAEYDCFACHHGLKEPSWRQQRAAADHPPGSLAWGNWYLSMLPALAGAGPEKNAALPPLLKKLDASMLKAYPDRAQAAQEARAASRELGQWLDKLKKTKYDGAAARALLAAVVQDDRKLADASWDSAAQLYLAAAALDHALRDLDQKYRENPAKVSIQEIVKKLGFPKNLDSPSDFQPELLRKELKEIEKKLGK